MGNKLAKERKEKRKAIKAEYALFRKRETIKIAVCGLPKNGKSTIIDQAIKLYGSAEKTDFIQSNYRLTEECRINEHCDTTITPTNSFKYLDCFTLLSDLQYFPPTDEIMRKWLEYEMKTDTQKKQFLNQLSNENELVVFGYIHNLELNECYNWDVIAKLIQRFYEFKVSFDSYIVQHQLNQYEFWELSDFYVETLEKLTLQSSLVLAATLFVVDLSVFDQVDDENNNKLDASMDLFGDIVNSKTNCSDCFIVYLNKKDIFEEKIKHLISRECESRALQNYDGGGCEQAIDCIRTQFKQQNNAENAEIFFFVVTASDNGPYHMDHTFRDTFSIIIECQLKKAGLI